MTTQKDKKKPDLSSLFNQYLRKIKRNGVVHIGAHQGQEVDEYLSQSFEKVILIEANPNWCNYLKNKFGNHKNIQIFNYAITDDEGEIDLLIHTSNSGSTEPASILAMEKFNQIVKTLHTPEKIRVPSITIDGLFKKHNLNPKNYSLLNIDIQGAELLALKGGQEILGNLSAIICEVQLLELYKNAPNEKEIINFLAKKGFKKTTGIYHELYDDTGTFPAWGEALFLKEKNEVE